MTADGGEVETTIYGAGE